MRIHLRSLRRPTDDRPRVPEQDVAWIAAGRQPFHAYTVGSLVPVLFDRYARVLHPAWAAPDVPVRWDAVAAWAGTQVHALAQWEALSRPRIDPHPPSPFVVQPDTGCLPPGHLAALCDLLAAHTTTPDQCFVGRWEGYGRMADSEWSPSPVLMLEQRTFLVRRGPIDLALSIGQRRSSGPLVAEPPTILWPADRSWFVASDPDLDSTYLGGPDALIESLVAHRDLEGWPVEAGDRVTIGSDVINAG